MSSNDDDGIYRVDTVPPPQGESDVYNAPTKVGPMAGAIVEEIVAQARREAEQAAAASRPSGTAGPAMGKPDDEAVVVDPAQLLNVEALTAQLDAAARATGDPPPAAEADPVVTAAAHKGRSAPPKKTTASERRDTGLAAAAPVAAKKKTVTVNPPAASSRAGTVLLFALVLALAGVGIYLLRH
jgi:hypothetical protein